MPYKEFLKREFETYYRQMFDTYEVYLQTMKDLVTECLRCNTKYWLGRSRRCKCDKQ